MVVEQNYGCIMYLRIGKLSKGQARSMFLLKRTIADGRKQFIHVHLHVLCFGCGRVFCLQRLWKKAALHVSLCRDDWNLVIYKE